MDWKAMLWFVAIVASIPLVLWLVKRSQLLGANAVAGTARTVAVLPLSASQKLVTVELGRGDDKLWLVLGVTPSSINTLHTMVALPLIPATVPGAMAEADRTGGSRRASEPAGPPAATFAALIGRLRGHEPDSHAR